MGKKVPKKNPGGRPREHGPRRGITIRFPVELAEKLSAVCQDRGMVQNEAVCRAVEQWLRRRQEWTHRRR